MEKHLMLVGMPGSGKTTLGRKWAEEMHVPLYEIDERLEEKFGISISEFVLLHGWEAFRDAEWNEIKEVLQKPVGVVVPGAGFFTNQERIDFALRQAEVVYLELDLKSLIQRLSNQEEREARPLLSQGELQITLKQLFEERIQFYNQAHRKIRV
jgi:shikimate kinase